MRPSAPASTLISVGDSDSLPTMTSRVDPEGARRMMEMLVNLYADRRLAVVREYVSNAVDASRVAGSAEPVRVTTPTLVDPHLTVSDSGTGMSTDEVEATFLAFAASTKRHSNDLIGGLGVGAKSAWALTESFLVDTVKGGKRTLVRAARDLSHQVLAAGVDSDSPDGTCITVPVEVEGQVQEWASVVQQVASAHAAGAVLVDGKKVPSLEGGPSWIGPVSCRQIGDSKGAVVVRSGGTLFASVPEVTRRVLETTKLISCVIELPVGSFDHTPSRESVVATERTMEAVADALRQYRAAYAALDKELSALAETDIVAAASLRSETLGGVGTVDHFVLGYRVEIPGDIGAWIRVSNPYRRHRWDRVGGRCESDGFRAIHGPKELARTVLVTDVPPRRSVRGFARLLESEQPEANRVIPIRRGHSAVCLPVIGPGGDRTDQTWDVSVETPGVEHYTFTQWCEKLAKQRTETVSAGGYFCQLVASDGAKPEPITLTAAEIRDSGLPVWYAYCGRPYHLVHDPASVGVYLGKRQAGPLTRVVPHAIGRGEWMEHRFISETAQWSHEEKLAIAFDLGNGLAYTALFDLAAAALRCIPADQDGSEALMQAAAFARLLAKVTPAQRSTLRAVLNSASAQRLVQEANQQYVALVRAYPLLQHFRKHYANHSDSVYLDYLIHTPPRPPEKAEAAAA
ncbi:HSP90 family protein [Mycobacteroides abscessus subsp. bolletii]|uniref:HSP90 family protein n=2 Tax=Mycobacteroides abscessus TaxID=36809 RepID=A0A9Q7WH36_9MYCO|nr:HSP90 family protein [Mycobacteroides abscessus subsp. bolletii]SIC67560.1 HSP90 family protein [Mycobacteroides abscessus subsp. abscessus]SHU07833.1 HSP90 family protein [Mycobacteroides abscessus subsp. bolletii]SHW85076.1 HSP90 family protein [Mycobacteroides abscessus subsp. bolletii]SKL89423.1 HSP90 family protein [Mycobacteroides abscessus subsp. bolletii]